MSSELVATEIADGVMRIRLNRADKKNALLQAMYVDLAEAFAEADRNPAVRAVLLHGTDGVFCAGNDIVDFLKSPRFDKEAPVLRFMHGMAACVKPIVVAVAGPAIGVGATLLAHADLAYAAPSARFQFPFVNIGICPEFASTYLLPRAIGHVQAAELLLLGEPFTAERALDARLINAVIPEAELEAHALKQAQKLAAQPPTAMRTSKELLKRWRKDFLDEVIDIEANHFGPMLDQPEAKEAMSAFVQKRKPDFSRFQ